jgi:hypothetical protein
LPSVQGSARFGSMKSESSKMTFISASASGWWYCTVYPWSTKGDIVCERRRVDSFSGRWSYIYQPYSLNEYKTIANSGRSCFALASDPFPTHLL